tara:strand:- start:9598 stop:10047 length:450 start_codon:yes stop_codon:yes gene_type:complete
MAHRCGLDKVVESMMGADPVETFGPLEEQLEEALCQRELLEGETIMSIKGFPGVYAIAAGGHTPGSSTIIIVATDEQTWIFSGDLTNDIASIHTNAGKGWLYSYFFVPENTALLEDWRLWLRDADEMKNVSVLPAHDVDHMREKLQELP